jgi:pyrrolidone-carboxylate peptidase
MIRRSGAAALLLTAALALPLLPAAPATAAACYDRTAPVTYEESRIETAAVPGGVRVPYALTEAGGFTPFVKRFTDELCAAQSVAAAERVAERRGAELWRAAVERAQGIRQLGTIDRYDDRPLYWSRLLGTRDVRQWRPSFPVPAAKRSGILKAFEYAARGISPKPIGGTLRVLVSGFDPYQLSGEIRRSNPSGAAALQLDGREFKAGSRTARVEAVMLPVTWSGFDAGVVEDAFGPHLKGATLLMTISQGGRATMNIEKWAGAWRGGFPDNNDEGTPGLIPRAPGWPQLDPQPEFIETTLPHARMIAAGTAPWPVRLNPRLCQWVGNTRPDPSKVVCGDNGPAPGGQAHSGGGGDYLSNESMYRANRLRLALKATGVPGGHLHISALVYPADPKVIIDGAFAADRARTVDQTVALVRAAIG